MHKKFFIVLFLYALPAICQANTNWVLQQSTLTYHMSHPIHQVYGVSHAAKGKGICHSGQCDFLIAAPVKSFDSQDSNRDLHMLEATRGAQFPMVIVRTRFSDASIASPKIYVDLDVQFAGDTAHYEHIPFQLTIQGDLVRISGTIPATCSDFKIVPPSFLTIPINNQIPVHVEMTWRRD